MKLYFMKNILIGFLVIASCRVYAKDLQCVDSYKTFENIEAESIRLLKSGNVDQLKAFNKQYDFTHLYNNKHPGQRYFYGDWIDEREAEVNLEVLATMFRLEKIKHIQSVQSKPKANFISSIGEVCVIPTQNKTVFFGETFKSSTDIIYVRNLENNQWYSYSFLGSELKEDFDELFPDFPKSVKLSPSSTRHAGREVSSAEISLKMLKALNIEVTPEIMSELEKKQKEIDDREKQNWLN